MACFSGEGESVIPVDGSLVPRESAEGDHCGKHGPRSVSTIRTVPSWARECTP